MLLPRPALIVLALSAFPIPVAARAQPADQEPNDSLSQAQLLEPRQVVSGRVGLGDDAQDWFRVVVPAEGYLTFTLQNSSAGKRSRMRRPEVHGPSGAAVQGAFPHTPAPGQRKDSRRMNVAAGTYTLRLRPKGQTVVDYSVEWRFEDVGSGGVGSGDVEPNDTGERASLLEPAQRIAGRVGFGEDRVDWYRFKAPANGTVILGVQNGAQGKWNGIRRPEVLVEGQALRRAFRGPVPAGEREASQAIQLAEGETVLVALRPAKRRGAIEYVLELTFGREG